MEDQAASFSIDLAVRGKDAELVAFLILGLIVGPPITDIRCQEELVYGVPRG